MTSELPLFSSTPQNAAQEVPPVLKQLQDIQPDSLSPREALDVLYELKSNVQ